MENQKCFKYHHTIIEKFGVCRLSQYTYKIRKKKHEECIYITVTTAQIYRKLHIQVNNTQSTNNESFITKQCLLT